MKEVLKIRNCKAGYKNLIIINGLDYDLLNQEIVGIVGLNGSGKSTYFKALARLIKSDFDVFDFNGQSVLNLSTSHLKNAGLCYCPQLELGFNNLSISENLKVGSLSDKDNPFYEFPGLSNIYLSIIKNKNQRFGSLSNGEQRILSIAINLHKNPKLILADEPTLGLSNELSIEMFNFFKSYQPKDGLSGIMIISHDYKRLLEICDFIYIFKQGELKSEKYTILDEIMAVLDQ
jgi:branched-chain amino acid transport system ATP-binding protein